MICAVASGKGGTGKTTLTASLAALWQGALTAVDLDVEEPNLHLFLKPALEAEIPAMLEVPVLDPERCTACGQCAQFCQYKALSVMGGRLLIFPDMCHGCGGCLALCPEGALSAGGRELGHVLSGHFARQGGESADFLMGRLRVGEAMSPPLMRRVKGLLRGRGRDILIDAPPGVSCPAVSAVMDADVIVLVTEPTPFGLHDVRLAVQAFRPLGRAMGLVLNRAGAAGQAGDEAVRAFCREENLPLWAELPFSLEAAQAYAKGEVLASALPELRQRFAGLMASVRAAGHASEARAAEAKISEAGHA